MPRVAKNPGARAGQKLCRYAYDFWFAKDNRLYLKVTGIEYERANEHSFGLAARRRAERILIMHGYDGRLARGMGGLEIWDVARNIADNLPEAYTYRTGVLPAEDEDDLALARA